MKILNDAPEEGNFVAVWEYQGCIWSDSFMFINGSLHIYQKNDEYGEVVDDWVPTEPKYHPGLAYNPVGIVPDRYFVVKD